MQSTVYVLISTLYSWDTSLNNTKSFAIVGLTF